MNVIAKRQGVFQMPERGLWIECSVEPAELDMKGIGKSSYCERE